jgi:hypothetical protein
MKVDDEEVNTISMEEGGRHRCAARLLFTWFSVRMLEWAVRTALAVLIRAFQNVADEAKFTVLNRGRSNSAQFGEMLLLEDLRRPATVTALDRVTALVLTRSVFNSVILGCGVKGALDQMRQTAKAAADKEKLEAEAARKEAKVQELEAEQAQQQWKQLKEVQTRAEHAAKDASQAVEDAQDDGDEPMIARLVVARTVAKEALEVARAEQEAARRVVDKEVQEAEEAARQAALEEAEAVAVSVAQTGGADAAKWRAQDFGVSAVRRARDFSILRVVEHELGLTEYDQQASFDDWNEMVR